MYIWMSHPSLCFVPVGGQYRIKFTKCRIRCICLSSIANSEAHYSEWVSYSSLIQLTLSLICLDLMEHLELLHAWLFQHFEHIFVSILFILQNTTVHSFVDFFEEGAIVLVSVLSTKNLRHTETKDCLFTGEVSFSRCPYWAELWAFQ